MRRHAQKPARLPAETQATPTGAVQRSESPDLKTPAVAPDVKHRALATGPAVVLPPNPWLELRSALGHGAVAGDLLVCDMATGFRWVWRDNAWRRYDPGLDDEDVLNAADDADVAAIWGSKADDTEDIPWP